MWKIVKNDFPYDKVASRHDMLIPLRHCIESNLTSEELREFVQIKRDISDQYDMFLENTNEKTRSIPEHFHLHLLQIKESEIKL